MRRLAVIGPPGADGEAVAELIAARLGVPVVRVRDAGRCDHCGGELFRRDDDHPDVVAMRVGIYRSAVAPALERYRALGVLRSVDATLTPEEIVEVALC